MSKVTTDQLKTIRIFAALDDQQLLAMVPYCQYQTFAKGAEIIQANDDSNDVYGVLSGVLRVSNFTFSGREVVYSDILKGGMAGEMSALDGELRSASVYAMTNIEVITIPAESFNTILYQCAPLAVALAQHLAEVIRISGKRIVDTSSRSTAVRLLQLLHEMSDPLEGDANTAEIPRLPAHRLLSGQLGCTRETITRLLNGFEEAGLIERKKNRLLITDVDSLLKTARENE